MVLKLLDFIGNKSKSLFWTLMNADLADKKEKSAFLCVNQRPELISDNVY